MFADRAHRKGLELLCTVHPTVCTTAQGDPLRLRQILTNLLSNAIKFTAQGEVAVRVTPAEASLVRFEIRDTGIGIGPDLQERIFDAFAQADGSITRQYGGTGLGLAIAKQLVEMMGGTMDVVSTPGQGATFGFTVHLEPSTASAPASFTPHTGLQGIRALIVDDNATSREMLHERLNAWGLQSHSTASGEHALTLLRAALTQSTPYDLALLDWQMPGMDGLALAGAIKADPALATMPLVLLIPHGDDSAMQAAQQAGVAYTLTTPIATSQLYDCLAAVLGLARICPAESDLRQHAAPPPQPSLSGHVLLAEDNPVNQEVAVSMLESLGCQVTVAATGREAVAAVQQRAYSVVLMDCHMPELDGLTATRIIREQEAQAGSRPMPIVALTASALAQDREACLAAGMDDHLSKPFTMEQLRAMLGRWLSSQTAAPAADMPAANGTAQADRPPERPGGPVAVPATHVAS